MAFLTPALGKSVPVRHINRSSNYSYFFYIVNYPQLSQRVFAKIIRQDIKVVERYYNKAETRKDKEFYGNLLDEVKENLVYEFGLIAELKQVLKDEVEKGKGS